MPVCEPCTGNNKEAYELILLAVNYRLKESDICYIFEHADVDAILVDDEFIPLLASYRSKHPTIPLIADPDGHPDDLNTPGPFDKAVVEGLHYDQDHGGSGWSGLEAQAPDETAVMALAYTSGTTSRPKGVEYTHRGAYMAAVGNIIESGLSYHSGRCRYLWTLPMFHAMGWYFSFTIRHEPRANQSLGWTCKQARGKEVM